MAGPVMEFWFEFDNAFSGAFGQVSDEIADAEGVVIPIIDRWHQHRAAGTYPQGFATAVQPVTSELLLLAEAQLAIVDRHFGGDAATEQVAFEEFGQGIHFDPRRPVTDKVHKMDRSRDGSTIGYHRWHAFIRAAVLIGADAQRWLGVDRLVGLAWAIQTAAMPREDATDNPRLPAARLRALRKVWLPMSVEQLDSAFDSRPFPPAALVDPAP
ncbi:MAG: hypothetical protein ACRDS1_16585 [Pseudonocardiaceae bacterium]